MKATEWVWRGFVLQALGGVVLVALAAGIHGLYLARAKDLVSEGVAVTAEVVRHHHKGSSSLKIRYEFGDMYETWLRNALPHPSSWVHSYAAGAELAVYIDPDEPRRAAMPDGHTSEAGGFGSLLPIPLLVLCPSGCRGSRGRRRFGCGSCSMLVLRTTGFVA